MPGVNWSLTVGKQAAYPGITGGLAGVMVFWKFRQRGAVLDYTFAL